jgi:hypothetical protein
MTSRWTDWSSGTPSSAKVAWSRCTPPQEQDWSARSPAHSRCPRFGGCRGDGQDIARHILALATYLGHAHPSDTYWYLQATPKLMAGISDAAERFFSGAGS